MRKRRTLGFVEVPGKRPRPELTVDYAKNARSIMDGIRLEDLCDPTKLSRLPYMGLVQPKARPGVEIDFWGSYEVRQVLEECLFLLEKRGPGFIQWVGPKGLGKSCILRAVACILYATLPLNVKLLCVWHTEATRSSVKVVDWVKGALSFAYIREEELAEIQGLETLEELKGFMSQREAMGEEFLFIVDGAQKIDVSKWHGGSRGEGEESLVVAAARHDLNSVLVGRKVIWGLTPLAEKVERQLEDLMDMGIVCYMEGCPEAVQSLKDRLITSVAEAPEKLNGDQQESAARKRDIEEFCGNHFLSVVCFEAACLQVAANRTVNARVTLEDVPELLADKQEWSEVTKEFTQRHDIKSITSSLELHLKINKPCPRLTDITNLDPRYALDWDSDEQTRFCTKYIHRVYMEFVRKAEAELLKTEPYHCWVDYCESLLAESRTNWAEMGWLCQRVSSAVIARAGVRISEELQINCLACQTFFTIPVLLKQAKELGADSGVGYISWRWNFGKVDMVILFKDSKHKLHLVGVQFTTNKGRHEHSEDEFMSVSEVSQWCPDIVTAVEKEELTLHFAFICEQSKTKQGTLKKFWNEAHFGVVPHWLHVTHFDEALKGRVTPKVLSCLRKMAERRELDCGDLPVAQPFPASPASPSATKTQLKYINHSQVNLLAVELGMNPKK